MTEHDTSTAPTPRRWPLIVAGAVAGAATALLAQQFISSDVEAQDTFTPATLATAEVRTADLVEEVEWDGEIAYSERAIVNGTGGTITATAEAGTIIGQGQTLLEIDALPMVLFYGTTPMYRTMTEGDVGPDVVVLETNLAALGYDPDATVTIDDTFTAYTELMVQRWQEDLELEATGEVDLGLVYVQPGESLLLVQPTIGDPATGDILQLASRANLAITVPVAPAESDEFAVGDALTVVLVDSSEVPGTVSNIGTEVSTDQNGSTIDVTVVLATGTDGLLEGPVTIRTTGQEVRGATVVPTRALVALSEGGYAVEKVGSDGSARLIGIELGTFDDGLVEITSGDLVSGDLVVVPQ